MSPVDQLLPHLSRVKRTGPGKHIACCPAHDDGAPSLAIRELDDGRLLLHCFAGCAAADVVGAVGLRMEDLFPERDRTPGAGHPRERRPFNAADLIDLAAWESAVAALIALDVITGKADADVDRLVVAAGRLANIKEAVHAR